MIQKLSRLFALALLVVFASTASAAVTLSPLFSDHMVLQRDAEVPIWGKASPGEKVSVTFADKTAEATADEKGEWMAKLPPLKLGDATSLTVKGADDSKVVLEDVLVGDVWICSGQSNMGFLTHSATNAAEEATNAKYPNIRFFKVPNVTAAHPTSALKGAWQVCSPETAPKFSAVAYFFGRDVHKREEIPIGLIENAWGGMPVESFMSDEAIKSDPDFKPLLERKAAAATTPAVGPSGKKRPADAPQWASNIYNSMVYPLLPYAVKGTIWYQGESNAGRAEQYRKLFPAMIRDWRTQFKQDFPFLFVQLANYSQKQPRPEQPADSAWAELREAQTMALTALPKTGMAVTIDIGESEDIHPKNKQDVGKRLALAAHKIAYGKDDVETSGPIYQSMRVDGKTIRVKFEHAKGMKFKDGAAKGFAIAGEDQKFVWADAKIEGDEVIVSAEGVEKPLAVRYAWADDPQISLFNADGLPASPFRTDDWKMKTAGVK
jgi:sialate O-acetylesterase